MSDPESYRAPAAKTRRARLGALALCLPLLGCGAGPRQIDYSSVELVPVRGVVLVNGRPVEGIKVRFYDRFGFSMFAEGVTDSAGRYRLRYDSNELGATTGPKFVVFLGGDSGLRLPARYTDTSGVAPPFELDVTASDAVFDFNLSTD